MQLGAVREYAGITCRNRADAGSGQCCVVKQNAGFFTACKYQRVCQRHAAFCVSVNRLYGFPIRRGDDVLRFVGVRTRAVLCQGQPAVDSDRQLQLGYGKQNTDGDCAALHVTVHVEHGLERFQIGSAGVENDALADETQISAGVLLAGTITETDDPGTIVGVALGDRKERACTQFFEFLACKAFVLPARCPGEIAHKIRIADRIQLIGGHGGEPTRQVITFRLRDGSRRVSALIHAQQTDALYLRGHRFVLVRRQAEGCR